MPAPHAALRGLFVASDLRHSDIAKAVGVSTAYLSHVMTAKRSPPIALAYRILELLGEPPESIFKYFPPNGGVVNSRTAIGRRTVP